VFGGLHHVAISVEPKQWQRLRAKLMDAGVGLDERRRILAVLSDPDGTRLELIADPLGELYGEKVLWTTLWAAIKAIVGCQRSQPIPNRRRRYRFRRLLVIRGTQ